MRFTIAASALFAGLVAANPITVTLQSTEVDTITSCGPEVTNCPARLSTSVSAVTVETSAPASVPAVVSSSSPVAPVATSAPFVASNGTATAQSTIYLYSTQVVTISSCAPTVTDCPLTMSTSSVLTGTSVVPVVPVTSAAASSPAASSPAASVPVAPYPVSSNGTVPAVGTAAGTAASSAVSGAASGTGVAVASPSVFMGAASSLNAGMALAGVGAFAAFLL